MHFGSFIVRKLGFACTRILKIKQQNQRPAFYCKCSWSVQFGKFLVRVKLTEAISWWTRGKRDTILIRSIFLCSRIKLKCAGNEKITIIVWLFTKWAATSGLTNREIFYPFRTLYQAYAAGSFAISPIYNLNCKNIELVKWVWSNNSSSSNNHNKGQLENQIRLLFLHRNRESAFGNENKMIELKLICQCSKVDKRTRYVSNMNEKNKARTLPLFSLILINQSTRSIAFFIEWKERFFRLNLKFQPAAAFPLMLHR